MRSSVKSEKRLPDPANHKPSKIDRFRSNPITNRFNLDKSRLNLAQNAKIRVIFSISWDKMVDFWVFFAFLEYFLAKNRIFLVAVKKTSKCTFPP
jgi:hypothetical protein